MLRYLTLDNDAGRSLGKKLVKSREGEIIFCTDDELCAWANDTIIVATDKEGQLLVEIDFSKRYVLFANEGVNIDDALTLGKYMAENHGGGIELIRVTE